MHHRILVALLFLALLPSVCFAQTQSPSTWGMLKTRYGQGDQIDSPSRFRAVEQAILSDPLLTDADLGLVGKLIQGSGFYGAGMRGGTQPFLVFVDGNYSVTKIIVLDDLSDGSSQVEAVDLRTGEKLWRNTDSAESGMSPNRTQLRPEGASLQRSLCAAIAAAASVWVATKCPPIPSVVAAVGAYVYETVYDACIDINFHQEPIAEDPDDWSSGTIGHNFSPRPGGDR